MKLIADYAPSAMKDLDIKNYFGGFSKLPHKPSYQQCSQNVGLVGPL